MASIFEEMMTANKKITESIKRDPRKAQKESRRKFNVRNIRVESRKFYEEADIDELEKEFEIPEEDSIMNDDPQETQDQVVLVIDPELPSEAEVPEDAAEDMIGDLVYKCPVCGSNYVCDCNEEGDIVGESIEVDEEGVPTECPICGDDADQILVGEIAPAEDVEGTDNTNLPLQDPVDEEEEVVDDELESLKNEDLDISISTDDEVQIDSVTVEDDGEVVVDQVVETEEGIDENVASTKCPKCGKDIDHCECMTEDIDDDTDIIIDDEPCDTCGDILAPNVTSEESDDPDVVITDSEVNMYFDDTKLESMMNKMMRENYKGAPSFKVRKVSSKGNTLKIEYIVRNGKRSQRGFLVCEGFITRRNRVISLRARDKGVFTESFRKSPIMVIECVNLRNKVIPTKITYNYKIRVNENLYRVTGSVGTKKKQTR